VLRKAVILLQAWVAGFVCDCGGVERDAAGLRQSEECDSLFEVPLLSGCLVHEFYNGITDVFSFFRSDSVVVAEEE
jgi:hypothetical protein